MKKPHVICHMMSTVDGRIVSQNWGTEQEINPLHLLYEKCHETFGSQAWMVGRITLEVNFANGKKPLLPKLKEPISREPFVADASATSFAIAVDAKGKLGWENNELGGDHIIQVLTEDISDAYLDYLQHKEISYIFAGKSEIDFTIALQQLGKLFPIKTIMLEGGGGINGSLLNEGLIDELSILLLPIADGTPNTPTVFEVSKNVKKKEASQMKLMEVVPLGHDVLWLKYKVENK